MIMKITIIMTIIIILFSTMQPITMHEKISSDGVMMSPAIDLIIYCQRIWAEISFFEKINNYSVVLWRLQVQLLH